MRTVSIDWSIDISEAQNTLLEMPITKAAAALGLGVHQYANMTTEERLDYAYDLWHHSPSALQEFSNLPDEVEIPDDSWDDGTITEYLTDEYGYFINGYVLDTDKAA